MSDPRWGDVRDRDAPEFDDSHGRVYDTRDRGDDDPRDSLMRNLDLPRGDERELVVDRDRVYELNGEDSRRLAAVGIFRVVPEQGLDTALDYNQRLRQLLFPEGIDRNRFNRTAIAAPLFNYLAPSESADQKDGEPRRNRTFNPQIKRRIKESK